MTSYNLQDADRDGSNADSVQHYLGAIDPYHNPDFPTDCELRDLNRRSSTPEERNDSDFAEEHMEGLLAYESSYSRYDGLNARARQTGVLSEDEFEQENPIQGMRSIYSLRPCSGPCMTYF